MTTAKEIENAIEQLPPSELQAFRSWYAEFDAARWDAQLERDVRSGKLDPLADEARRDFAHNRCRPL
ncbi:MAG TPA: hypothetical protein PKE12_15430 [Kiritimatiellia bacterium]|nr:hypothetical protein [Kiritimatiellia bacterium]